VRTGPSEAELAKAFLAMEARAAAPVLGSWDEEDLAELWESSAFEFPTACVAMCRRSGSPRTPLFFAVRLEGYSAGPTREPSHCESEEQQENIHEDCRSILETTPDFDLDRLRKLLSDSLRRSGRILPTSRPGQSARTPR
jgi:hypothetical protein